VIEPRPFDIRTLESVILAEHHALRGPIPEIDRGYVCRRLGIEDAYLLYLRRQGLTVDRADRLAVAAGFHPCQVWSSWFPDEDATSRLFVKLWAETRGGALARSA
jgi:hypothetical protein